MNFNDMTKIDQLYCKMMYEIGILLFGPGDEIVIKINPDKYGRI